MLMERILSRENLLSALKRVERNKGSHGAEGMSVQNLRAHIFEHLATMKIELLEGTYKPQPVRRIEIPKPDVGVRLLGIPTVTDRLIQQAIAQVLTSLYDRSEERRVGKKWRSRIWACSRKDNGKRCRR